MIREPLRFVCSVGPVMLLLVGCGGGEPPDLLDTGWFDAATTGEVCADTYVSWWPEDGTTGWYWRDWPGAATATSRQEAYDAWLVDGAGHRYGTELIWGPEGLTFDLVASGALAPSTDYALSLKDCAQVREIGFSTSALGTPLEAGPGSLVGNVYVLDLGSATWQEPPGLGALVGAYVQDPVLVAVTYADATDLRLTGAPTEPLGDGVVQDLGVATWAFGVADFTEQPFFDARSESVLLQYRVKSDSTDIPVEDFVLQGTFSADGERLGGVVLAGRADTREIGRSLAPNDPGRLCDLAATQGVSCVACSDGEPLCLDIRATGVEGTLDRSLRVVPVL